MKSDVDQRFELKALAGHVEFESVGEGCDGLARFLLDLRITKRELLAVVPDGPNHVVYYHVRANPNEMRFCMNIHDIVTALRGLTNLPSRNYMVRHHLEKMPADAVQGVEYLANLLDPKVPSCHIIPRDEMAAIILRAYWIGYVVGQEDLKAEVLT